MCHILKPNRFQHKLIHQQNYSILDNEMQTLQDKNRLKECLTIESALQKILQGILQTADKNKFIHEVT